MTSIAEERFLGIQSTTRMLSYDLNILIKKLFPPSIKRRERQTGLWGHCRPCVSSPTTENSRLIKTNLLVMSAILNIPL